MVLSFTSLLGCQISAESLFGEVKYRDTRLHSFFPSGVPDLWDTYTPLRGDEMHPKIGASVHVSPGEKWQGWDGGCGS